MDQTLHVRLLWDEYSTREFVIFRTGEFANPLAILTEAYAEQFLAALKEAVEKPPQVVRSIEYLSANLKYTDQGENV